MVRKNGSEYQFCSTASGLPRGLVKVHCGNGEDVGVRGQGARFIQNPFSPEELARIASRGTGATGEGAAACTPVAHDGAAVRGFRRPYWRRAVPKRSMKATRSTWFTGATPIGTLLPPSRRQRCHGFWSPPHRSRRWLQGSLQGAWMRRFRDLPFSGRGSAHRVAAHMLN